MILDHKKYHKIIKLKAVNFKFKYVKELSELLDLILQYKKHTIRQLKTVSNAPVLNWIDLLNKKESEDFMVDVYMVDLLDIFAELCHKTLSGIL